MNLGEIEQDIYDTWGYGTSAAISVKDARRIRMYVNSSYLELMGLKGMSKLRRQVVTFASAVNAAYAVLPQAVNRIIGPLVERSQQQLVFERPLNQIKEFDPGQVTTGNPYNYSVLGYSVATVDEPVAPCALKLVSDSASDVSTAYVEGIRNAEKSILQASKVLTGTVEVTLDANTDWIMVTKFHLSAPAVGTVRITNATTAAILGLITKGRSQTRYTRIQFYPVPTAILTYYALADLMVMPLANDSDEPLLPIDYHTILVAKANMREASRPGRNDTLTYKAETDRFRALRADMMLYLSRMPEIGGGEMRWSQLGPYFPPGS